MSGLVAGERRRGAGPAPGADRCALFQPYRGTEPEPVGFLLVPRFSMMAFISAVEPLRVANRFAGRTLFSWHIFSADGGPVEASNGMSLAAEAAIDKAAVPTLIVCAGFDPRAHGKKPLIATLRRLAHRGVTLGALDTGAHLLARAGLLDDSRVTMHWEAVPAFREDFPDIEVSDELFEVGDGHFTCAGGTAAIDLMLDMIARKHGSDLAVKISEQFIHERIRDRHDAQRLKLAKRLGVTNSRVLRIVELMERHLDEPLSARRLASSAGVSGRQLERLFRANLGVTPGAYYLGLRLQRVRQLLRETDKSVLEIALACGFTSASSVSRAYRARFGVAPSQDRKEEHDGGGTPRATIAAERRP